MEVVNRLSGLQRPAHRKETCMKQFDSVFSENYHIYYPKVCKQIYYLTGSNDLAQDLAQEVFMKYFKTKGQPEHIGAWLSKVAVRTAYNYFRGEKRRISREESVFEWMEEILSTEDQVFRHEEVLAVRKILRQLDERYSVCLTMKFSGYSYDEIHQATGIPRNNISQMIARGKKKFADLYRKEGV